MSGYIYTLLDHLLFTPKLDFDSRFDSRYRIFKQFQNNILVQYSLFLQLETRISMLDSFKGCAFKNKSKIEF